MWLSVPPVHVDEVGAALASHPEVTYAAATTGPTNLAAWISCTDSDAFYRYLSGRLGGINTVHHVETALISRTVKRAGASSPN